MIELIVIALVASIFWLVVFGVLGVLWLPGRPPWSSSLSHLSTCRSSAPYAIP